MKYFVSILVLMLFALDASAANNGRPAVNGKMVMAAPRYTASINQLNGTSVGVKVSATAEEQKVEEEKDMREAERNACINNNIGFNNTFVWASKYSNTDNYASMVEDVEHPENNVCFVRVELKSDDESRVKVSDIGPKYFMWGEAIECGSWVDAADMEKRILDERKGARIGGIVASTVGGAGLGVGVMELIGNTSIKGWTGQKELSGTELYKSQLLVMKNNNDPKYDEVRKNLLIIKANRETMGSDYEKYKDLIDIVE